jgi:CRISPR-associated protein Csm3
MFNETGNSAVLRIRIVTVTPLLIRAGDTGLDPGGTDLKCVRTRHGSMDRTVYIPGSSLKGVLRSTAESMVRGHKWQGIEGACDPLAKGSACSDRVPSGASGAEVHRLHCLACRLFGSLKIKGRASPRDMFPWKGDGATLSDEDRETARAANATQVRFGVAINRVSGGASRGKLFDHESVPPGTEFWGDIALENYQVWQLGLLATVFDDLKDGFAQLGSSKSRGLGVVTVAPESLVHKQPARAGDHPAGVGHIFRMEQARAYGLLPEADLPKVEGRSRGLFRQFALGPDDTKGWLDAGRKALEAL